MALIMMCGQPCSGKSTVAASLAAALEQRGVSAILVDHRVFPLPIAQAFTDSAAEKITRAALKAEVARRLTRSSVVVLDSLNSIKGFRYEMWCLARAAGTRSCVVHVATPADVCRQWNGTRGQQAAYPPGVLEDLLGRFERPDSKSRWDAPLFEVSPWQEDGDQVAAVLQRAAAAMVGGAAASAPAAALLNPTVATAAPAASSTNLLGDIDSAAQHVIERIVDAQQAAGGSAGHLQFSADGSVTLDLSSSLSLPELRRHKRGFIKLATQNALTIRDSDQATRLFVSYLQPQLE